MIRICTLFGFAALAVAAPKPEDIVPRPKAPYVQPVATERAELHQAINGYMATPPAQVVAHPAAKDFPGAVESKARVNRSVPFDATLVSPGTPTRTTPPTSRPVRTPGRRRASTPRPARSSP